MVKLRHEVVAAACTAVLFVACGSTEEITVPTAEQRFEQAMELYNDESYQEAIDQFSVITLQHQGSSVADDAQFYLGESRFERHEYLLAAFEYQQLRRNMPASSFQAQAQYKLGLCYYNLSPKSSLDQQYTLKAIDEFQRLVEYYPGTEYAPVGEEKIAELTAKLARKEYDTARLYARMEYYRAATLYYDAVIERYHDTEYAPLAYLGKAEALLERNMLIEARRTVLKFLEAYPQSVERPDAERLLDRIEDRL
jgi:outer membrane protein assembly factor BamD